MKPRGLLFFLASFALWTELPAAPPKGTGSAGSSPLFQVGGMGTDQLGESLWKGTGSTLPWVPNKTAVEVLQNNSGPQEQPGSKEVKTGGFSREEGLASRDARLPSAEAKPVHKKRFLLEGRPGDKTEGVSAGKPQVRNLFLQKKPGLGVGIASGGAELLLTPGSLCSAEEKPPSDMGRVAHAESRPDRMPVSGGKPRTGEKPASPMEPGNPGPGVKPPLQKGVTVNLEEAYSYDNYDDYNDNKDDYNNSYDDYYSDDDDDNEDDDDDDDDGDGDGRSA